MSTIVSPPKAEVTVFSPLFSSPHRQPLRGESISIGRASECSIPIRDRYLSRKHAEIVAVGGNWVLKDCGSANGTYLNGARVQKDTLLSSGDRIRLGDTEILFMTSEQTTDRYLSIADTAVQPSIEIPVQEIDVTAHEPVDVPRLQTLNALARELIEDRPLYELFGFIVERVMEHLKPSRAAIALLAPDSESFSQVEVRRRDESDISELTISHTLLKTMVQQKKALAFVDVASDEKLSMSKSIAMQGIRSILCAPLIIGDAVSGVLYVDYLVTQKSISTDDVRLVAQIARFAAIKLETTLLREEAIEKRIMDEELRTASNIQRRLLPEAPRNVRGYSFVGTNQPSRTVSGDYYDFIIRPDGRIYFVIADVSGKGVPAGLMMAGLQIAFRIFAKDDPDPARFVTELNTALHETLPRSKFVTLFLGRLDTNSGKVEFVNAGHTPPLWIRRTGVEEVVAGDILLGVITLASYNTRSLQLEPGDSLALFTDGVTEAENSSGVELGARSLAAALRGTHGRSADDVADAISEAVVTHAGDAEALDDDVTVVIVTRDVLPQA
ncbi:MAG TPA: SpoIIE family protein phosphatase [Thermoanaerobaculia bacterium]|jgi:serine phosphatase RsbU (regulator of sigma subunit)/pSer/pThr/pTyr-binding forkhead associated (FHA) protein|nr:SpoIIE family protein phosphatase [Thermoanaerobaculia bacterium]